MIWKFWTNKKNETLAGIQELLRPIDQQLTLLNQHHASHSEQITEVDDQVRKLNRLQYKSGQDVQRKLEGLSISLESVQQWQVKNAVDKSYIDTLEMQRGQVGNLLFVLLDDFDLLTSSLRDQGQEMWQQLLEKWTSQVLEALQIQGIYEMQLLGTSFDPQVAEAIGTVVQQHQLPYEVAEVVKRGFLTYDGRMIRKAQVITFQEDEG